MRIPIHTMQTEQHMNVHVFERGKRRWKYHLASSFWYIFTESLFWAGFMEPQLMLECQISKSVDSFVTALVSTPRTALSLFLNTTYCFVRGNVVKISSKVYKFRTLFASSRPFFTEIELPYKWYSLRARQPKNQSKILLHS